MKKLLPLFAIILLGALYFSLRSSFTPQSANINLVTAPSPTPFANLTFEPYFIALPANTQTKLGITINMSPEFSAKTARLDINFNQHCYAPSIVSGTDFPRLVGPVGLGGNTLRATFSAGTNPVVNYGIVAYLTASAKNTGNCQLSFTDKTAILNPQGQNILTSTTPATIKLKTVDPNLPGFKQPVYKPDTLSR